MSLAPVADTVGYSIDASRIPLLRAPNMEYRIYQELRYIITFYCVLTQLSDVCSNNQSTFTIVFSSLLICIAP